MNKTIYILTVLSVLFWSGQLRSQVSYTDEDVRVNQQAWLDYNFARGLDENRDITTQLGFRKITPEVYDRFLAISTMNFKNRTKAPFLKLIGSFHAGAGVIYTSNYDAKDNLELRLLQGLKFHIPTIKPITLHNYIRFEQRFQNSFGEGWTTGFRFRYRLSTAITLGQKLLRFTKGIYFPVESELFINFKKADRFNDVLRLSPGIGYKLPSGWKIEMYLIFNQTKNITETNSTSSDFIIRIRVRNDSNRRLANQAIDDLQDSPDPTKLKQQ